MLRVYTQLVQTDVMVLDRQGRFVKGLKSSDFELRIDGKPKQIEFFEMITAGSINEEAQLAAARGYSGRPTDGKSNAPAPLDRGRVVFFYVDDLHLDLPSLTTTQKLITHFIENQLGQNDEVAISSASGQIGFLQQLTDHKSVLRAALARLNFRPYSVRDSQRPTMTEYQGLLITRNDHDTSEYFIAQTLREYPGISAEAAAGLVNGRARTVVQQGASVTTNTLSGLEALVRSANKLPGRKVVFFISGGFFVDALNSDSQYRLKRITSAAARNGVVIYSLDARGLVGSLSDISAPSPSDLSGRLMGSGMGELSATQDAMNALASDTGGRTIFNTNSLEPGLSRALTGSSTYYLLAWKPEVQNEHASKFRRLEVKVIGKPELTVQVRRGFFDREPEIVDTKSAKASNTEKNDKPKKESAPIPPSEAELRKVLLAPYPNRDIPVSLSLTYMNTPAKKPLLSAAIQVPMEFLSFTAVNGKQVAAVTVAGTIFDQKGNPGAAFSNRIKIEAPSIEESREGPELTYGYPVYVAPGLYHVRVGVRDDKSGRTGTAHSWIEVPNLASGNLALSSLLMGVRAQPAISNASASAESLRDTVDFSVSHNFSANGYLRFMVIVYNAALAATDSKPDVAIQVQILRDEQPVVTTALKKVSADNMADPTQIPYAAEVSLSGLPSGRYVLHVAVVDRVTKKSATQQTRFEIQ